MDIVFKPFVVCKMVFDSVGSSDVLFSDNHAFIATLVHEESLSIDVQPFPYLSNSEQPGPGRMLLPQWKLLLKFWLVI